MGFDAKGEVILTGDSYWKGQNDHENAKSIAEHYGCPDQYAVTEMEEIGIMNAAECYGMKDRVISLRVIMNMDTFLNGESPEELWADEKSFSDQGTETNSDTVDIFELGMKNLFDAGRIVIDTALAGDLQT